MRDRCQVMTWGQHRGGAVVRDQTDFLDNQKVTRKPLHLDVLKRTSKYHCHQQSLIFHWNPPLFLTQLICHSPESPQDGSSMHTQNILEMTLLYHPCVLNQLQRSEIIENVSAAWLLMQNSETKGNWKVLSFKCNERHFSSNIPQTLSRQFTIANDFYRRPARSCYSQVTHEMAAERHTWDHFQRDHPVLRQVLTNFKGLKLYTVYFLLSLLLIYKSETKGNQ